MRVDRACRVGILLLGVVVAAACSTPPPPPPEPPDVARERAFIARFDTEPPAGTWRSGNSAVGIEVTGFAYLPDLDGALAPDGSRWVTVNVTVTNDSPGPIRIDPARFTMVTRSGKPYPSDLIMFRWCSQPLRAFEVRSHSSASGCVVFQTEAASGPAAIYYSGAKTRRGTDVMVDLQRLPDIAAPAVPAV